MSESKHICAQHSTQAAEFYCACTGEKLFLCGLCVAPHMQRLPGLVHHMVSVAVESINLHVYQQRKEAFEAGTAELRQSLAAVDQCCEEVTTAVETLIGKLKAARDYWVRELQSWKTKLSVVINEAEEDVQSSLVYEDAHLNSRLAEALRNHTPGSLVIFAYELTSNQLSDSIDKLVLVNFPHQELYAAPPILATLFNSELNLFDVQACVWQTTVQLERSISCDIGTSYAYPAANTILCCGNDMSGVDAYRIRVNSGLYDVEDLPKLKNTRSSAGLLCFQSEAFVFGSSSRLNDNPTVSEDCDISVEVLSLSQPLAWELLPEKMSCYRVNFMPCVYEDKAYLCRASDEYMDVLDLLTRKFLSPIAVQLPSEKFKNAVSIVVEDELVLFSTNYTTRIHLHTFASRVDQHKETRLQPLTTAVVYGDWVYWVRWGDLKCMRVNITDTTFEEF